MPKRSKQHRHLNDANLHAKIRRIEIAAEQSAHKKLAENDKAIIERLQNALAEAKDEVILRLGYGGYNPGPISTLLKTVFCF